MPASGLHAMYVAALLLCASACATLNTKLYHIPVTLSDGTTLSLPQTDSPIDCPEPYNSSENANYTCIEPGSPGLLERVKTALSNSGYIQYDDLQIWSEFCNETNSAAVLWIFDELDYRANTAEKRTYIETVPVAIGISQETCDEILVQDSVIANELGLVFSYRVRVRDTYKDKETDRWVFGVSENSRYQGFVFFPEFGRELASFNEFRAELGRVGFVGAETNPQLGGQVFCRDDRDALFITSYEDHSYLRNFDYFSMRYKATDPRLTPLFVQYFPGNGCGMRYG